MKLRKIITTLITTTATVTVLAGLTGCGPSESPSTAKAAQSTPKATPIPKAKSEANAKPKEAPKPARSKPAPKSAAKPKPKPKSKPGVTAAVYRWIDGDTVDTSRGTIRLIGVDTPERGRCGATRATNAAKRWAPAGSTIRLVNPSSVVDKDRYGRSLRYAVRGKIDISKAQIVKGAKARYDSTDGYDWHPRQSSYHAADRAHKDYTCSKPKPKKKASSRNCTPGYTPCLRPRYDYDCADIDGSVLVTGSDPYRLDRDGDGVGCDS